MSTIGSVPRLHAAAVANRRPVACVPADLPTLRLAARVAACSEPLSILRDLTYAARRRNHGHHHEDHVAVSQALTIYTMELRRAKGLRSKLGDDGSWSHADEIETPRFLGDNVAATMACARHAAQERLIEMLLRERAANQDPTRHLDAATRRLEQDLRALYEAWAVHVNERLSRRDAERPHPAVLFVWSRLPSQAPHSIELRLIPNAPAAPWEIWRIHKRFEPHRVDWDPRVALR